MIWCASLHYVMWYCTYWHSVLYIVKYPGTSCHPMSYHVMSYHIMCYFYHTISYHNIAHHIIMYIISSHVVSCHAMPCHVLCVWSHWGPHCCHPGCLGSPGRPYIYALVDMSYGYGYDMCNMSCEWGMWYMPPVELSYGCAVLYVIWVWYVYSPSWG